jgi:hypothetical protein
VELVGVVAEEGLSEQGVAVEVHDEAVVVECPSLRADPRLD